jgi:6-pyruvoyltetrahydropterin/6-carboxytetrahydropterin synthase
MSPKDWMEYMFDHTLVVAEDDPYLEGFKAMGDHGLTQTRVVPATGAEQFAKFIYEKLNTFIDEETSGRVKVVKVEFREHGKNSAIYGD